jgi:YHS domain-containing protein
MFETLSHHTRTTGIAGKARMIALALMMAIGGAVGGAVTAASGAQVVGEVNVNDGYAVHGYDVVAYFTAGAPAEGDDRFTAAYQGAQYRFASAEHRDTFKQDPAKYAPQYGGFCAFGTSVGRKFDGDPHAWRIVDGKLYLNLNKKIQTRWLQDTDGYIRGANHNWPIIAGVPDAELEANPPEGLTLGAV